MNNKNCDEENCQREMLEKLKTIMKEELNIEGNKFEKKLVDIIRINLKSDLSKEIKKCRDSLQYSNLFDFLNNLLVVVFTVFLMFYWIVGIVIAKGFWSTLFAIIPFYSWYLVVDFYLTKYGFLQ